MTSSLYISTTEAGSGKALISLGIIELILRKTNKVAFFRPVIRKQPCGKQDEDINLILNYFALNQSYDRAFGLYTEEVQELISQTNYDEVLDKIIAKYKHLEQNYDFKYLCKINCVLLGGKGGRGSRGSRGGKMTITILH